MIGKGGGAAEGYLPPAGARPGATCSTMLALLAFLCHVPGACHHMSRPSQAPAK